MVEVLRAPVFMDASLFMPPQAPVHLPVAGNSLHLTQDAAQAVQQPPRRPKEQRRWQGKRRGGKRKRQANGPGGGQHPNAPALKQLQQTNAKRARRHFSRKEEANVMTPRTVPHAPLNTTGFLMAQNGQRTPVALRRTGAGEEVENLDFFGTNDGLVLREDSPPANSDEDQSSDDSDSDAGEPDDSREDQTAYIMSLEQQNLHLKESNLNLQEKCYILEQRLKYMEQQRQQQPEEGEQLTEPQPMLSEGPAANDAATLDDGTSAARRSSWEDDS